MNNPSDNRVDLDREKYQRMLDKAHEIRRFEIDLYWKRTTYFSVFTTLLFTAYFAVLIADGIGNQSTILLAISGFGLVFCAIWIFANRAGVFWYEHWEKYVDKYERKLGEKLHAKKPCPYTKPTSLKRLNYCILALVLIMWICALFYAIYPLLICALST